MTEYKHEKRKGKFRDALWLIRDWCDGYYIIYGRRPKFTAGGDYLWTPLAYCLQNWAAGFYENTVHHRHHLKPGEIRRIGKTKRVTEIGEEVKR